MWKSKTKQRMIFGMIHVKDSLLLMGKNWVDFDFLDMPGSSRVCNPFIFTLENLTYVEDPGICIYSCFCSGVLCKHSLTLAALIRPHLVPLGS